jgi:hypothetical protein
MRLVSGFVTFTTNCEAGPFGMPASWYSYSLQDGGGLIGGQ